MIPNMVYIINDKKVLDLIPQDRWDSISILALHTAYKIDSVDWVCSWYHNKEYMLKQKLGG